MPLSISVLLCLRSTINPVSSFFSDQLAHHPQVASHMIPGATTATTSTVDPTKEQTGNVRSLPPTYQRTHVKSISCSNINLNLVNRNLIALNNLNQLNNPNLNTTTNTNIYNNMGVLNTNPNQVRLSNNQLNQLPNQQQQIQQIQLQQQFQPHQLQQQYFLSQKMSIPNFNPNNNNNLKHSLLHSNQTNYSPSVSQNVRHGLQITMDNSIANSSINQPGPQGDLMTHL